MSIEAAKHRILNRVPLEGLIGETVKLETRSGRAVGLCPFHEEKSGSFTIFSDHYFCFGCHARGDAIDFVRKEVGLSFIEALRHLATKYGIEVPELEESRDNQRQRNEDASLYQTLEMAQNFFVKNLQGESGEAARKYLVERGFNLEQIEEYGFGLSLDDPFALVNHIKRCGIAERHVSVCSLASTSPKSGKLYDFFQNRLMIPIRDPQGRVIAFGGRAMDDDPAKYKNSRETPLFDKSSTLFGLHQAKHAIRQQAKVIVVEGYMDALQLWNHGIKGAIACLGTALTIHHLRALTNFSSDVYLVFDGDSAGRKASLRAVTGALEVPKLHIKVVVLPDKDDPDSYVRKHGKEGFSNLLASAEDLLSYAINNKLKETHEMGIPHLINTEFVPWLQTITDKMKYALLVNKIAQLTGIPYNDIDRAVAGTKKAIGPAAEVIEAKVVGRNLRAVSSRPLTALEGELLGHIYYSSSGQVDVAMIRQLVHDKLEMDDLWLDLTMEMLDYLAIDKSPAIRPKTEWICSADHRVLNLLDYLSKKAAAFECEDRQKQIEIISATLHINSIKESRTTLKKRLATLPTTSENSEETLRILKAIQKLNCDLSRLENRN